MYTKIHFNKLRDSENNSIELYNGDNYKLYLAHQELPEHIKYIHLDQELFINDNEFTTMLENALNSFPQYLGYDKGEHYRPELFNLKNGMPAANYYKIEHAQIRYIPAARVERYAEQGYSEEAYKKLSQTCKIAKIARLLFTQEALDLFGITEAILEQYAYSVRALSDLSMYDLDVVTGADILDAYNVDNYASRSDYGSGTLLNSCMRHHFAQEYINFYAGIKDCSCIVLREQQNGMIVARALLWTCYLTHNGNTEIVKYMDRVYYGPEHLNKMLKNYARKNGYYYFDSYNVVCDASGAQLHGARLTVITGYTRRLSSYPYADTFCYMMDDYTQINNYSGHYLLHSVSGRLETEYGYDDDDDDDNVAQAFSCVACGNHFHYDDDDYTMFDGLPYCDSCYADTFYTSRINNFAETYRENAPQVTCVQCEQEVPECDAQYLEADFDRCYVCSECENNGACAYTQARVDSSYTTGYSILVLRAHCIVEHNHYGFPTYAHMSTLQLSMF